MVPAPQQRDFIDEMAALLGQWGLPATAGRLYGYLLLQAEPVSLEQIAADLDMSKAGAWNAARLLEQNGSARRSTERGSKRVFFRLGNDMAPCMLDQLRLLGSIGRLMRTMGPDVAEGAIDERMQRIADSCLMIERTVLQILSRDRTEAEDAPPTD
jgi:predicted ArsR family transcriptional regulator